jgi:hypothetical protein
MKFFKKLEETIERVATNTIGYTRKQANKEWFDVECQVLRQNTKQRFRTFWNPTGIKTGKRIIYAAFQCRAGSYRTTTKPTNNWQNLQHNLSRSQSAVGDGYLALKRETTKVGLKINEQKTKYIIAARNDS